MINWENMHFRKNFFLIVQEMKAEQSPQIVSVSTWRLESIRKFAKSLQHARGEEFVKKLNWTVVWQFLNLIHNSELATVYHHDWNLHLSSRCKTICGKMQISISTNYQTDANKQKQSQNFEGICGLGPHDISRHEWHQIASSSWISPGFQNTTRSNSIEQRSMYHKQNIDAFLQWQPEPAHSFSDTAMKLAPKSDMPSKIG